MLRHGNFDTGFFIRGDIYCSHVVFGFFFLYFILHAYNQIAIIYNTD